MKTNKLLFTFLFACISLMGMSKNNDSPIKIEIEDDMFACNPPPISGISVSTITCPGNQNTFKFDWPSSTSNQFYRYQYVLNDKNGNILQQGYISQASQSNVTFTVNSSLKAVKFKVRVIFTCGYTPKLGYIRKSGNWGIFRHRLARRTIPITSVTSMGSYCSQNTVTFTPAPNSSLNDEYHWEIDFGPGLPLQTGISTKSAPAFSVISIPIQYSGGPVNVYVTPKNFSCGFGTTYHQVFTPAAPAIYDLSNTIINLPSSYCPGTSNTFEATPLIPGVEYKWTFAYVASNPSTSPIISQGFEMNKFSPNFGSGNPTGTGAVTSYYVSLEVRSGCKPWSDPISKGPIQVSYSNNCNPIGSISSLSRGQSKSQTDLFDMNIYPNPSSSGVFNVNTLGLEGAKKIQVYDISGKYIIEKTLEANQSKLDLSSYSRGLYFVKISNGVDQKTRKIIF
ncbi:T9SS type A sorting domain-containing protein [Aquimarina sp. Aq78]|uniref:T9SS type A sorting domain-containing protein n=1 Tax=Aquimarina sp. Aq78 TaxID=1191889 RepID=UPI000D0EEC14|nr:T9SS type A sorting domain-containing protein [Aquimarina sp. Aq78]